MPKESNDLVHQFRLLLPYKMSDITEDNVEDFHSGRFVRTTKNDLGLNDVIINDIDLEMIHYNPSCTKSSQISLQKKKQHKATFAPWLS